MLSVQDSALKGLGVVTPNTSWIPDPEQCGYAVYGTVLSQVVPTYCPRDQRALIIVWLSWAKLVYTM